jgi:hypothetical protein
MHFPLYRTDSGRGICRPHQLRMRGLTSSIAFGA